MMEMLDRVTARDGLAGRFGAPEEVEALRRHARRFESLAAAVHDDDCADRFRRTACDLYGRIAMLEHGDLDPAI